MAVSCRRKPQAGCRSARRCPPRGRRDCGSRNLQGRRLSEYHHGDLGGTSFDVSLVVDGQTSLAAQTTIDFGLVVRTPMIEITTIGAGGGSIAHVDAGGLLQVGPESAGSRPGPVAYGQGNTPRP